MSAQARPLQSSRAPKRGRGATRLTVFQASPPLSRPHPVDLLPPKGAPAHHSKSAPVASRKWADKDDGPISAPLVEPLTLTMPQSLPSGPIHLKQLAMSCVKRDEESPCSTELLSSMASSSVSNVET